VEHFLGPTRNLRAEMLVLAPHFRRTVPGDKADRPHIIRPLMVLNLGATDTIIERPTRANIE